MRRHRVITSISALGLAALLPLSGVGGASASPAPSTAPAAAARAALTAHLGPGGRVIVLLKNHSTTFNAHSSAQKRAAVSGRSQLTSLAGRIQHDGGHVTRSYTLINGLAATVTQSQADSLAADPAVSEVIPDEPIRATTGSGATKADPSDAQPPVAAPAGTCAADGGVQLEPQALEATRADSDLPGAKTARSLGYTGKGVTVGWIADGLDINNPDFIRDGRSIFTDYQDFGGDGVDSPTGGDEAFLDASAIAAQGNQTYDISHFSALPLQTACQIRVEGEAPGVNLVGLNIFGNEDTGYNSSFVQAIQYAATVDHVDVLNESLGSNPYPDDPAALDAVKAANDAAVAQGVTVTASSGDAGVTNTIGSPATDSHVISVGGSTTYRFYLQTGYGGGRLPGIKGWVDNNISALSSAGFQQDGRTVDLVAPGDLNWALCTADPTRYSECTDFLGNPSNLEESGGTSESAPVVAGVAALVIEAYRTAHNGASPSPAVVKSVLTSTADDIRAPGEQQGAGLVDAYKAVQLAASYRSAQRTGHTILTSKGQLQATGARAVTKTFTETVANTGTAKQTVTARTRTLGAYKQVKSATVTLSDAHSSKYVDFQGITDNYAKVTFAVPSGVDRLDASIAFQGASADDPAARVRLDLVDPAGRLASYSLPQGNGNYGNGQVASPKAGTWTAYIASRNSNDGGTEGPVLFSARTAKFTSLGSVSPSKLVLAPGASGTLTVKAATPKTPGDLAGSLVLGTSVTDAGIPATTTMPVLLRSLVPSSAQSFRASLTGGNGRATFTGQTFYYALDLAKGKPELNATLTLAARPSNTFYAWLIAPDGNAQATASNQVLTTAVGGTELAGKPTVGAQLHVLKPAAGRWTLIVTFAPQVSGDAISTPFTVATNQTAVPVKASGLPKKIKTGTTKTVTVTVKNTGTSPEAFFIDPRLSSSSVYELAPLTDPVTTVPFRSGQSSPQFLVPTGTTRIAAAAQTDGDVPIQFDASAPTGDPDLLSDVGTEVSAGYAASPVAHGQWGVLATEVGPFQAPGTAESVESAMVAKTRTFDLSATASTGDLWLAALDPSSTLDTVTVKPGHSVSITVRIHVTGKPRTVHGTLYVDDADLFNLYGGLTPDANEVAAVPYSYTVTK